MHSLLAHVRRHVIAYPALFLALGGTSYAASAMWSGDNIIDGSLTGADVQNGSIQAADLASGTGGGGVAPITAHVPIPATAPASFSDPGEEHAVLTVPGLGLLFVSGCIDGGGGDGSADAMWLKFRNTSDAKVVVGDRQMTRVVAPGDTIGMGNPRHSDQGVQSGQWAVRNGMAPVGNANSHVVLSRQNATLAPSAWLDITNEYEAPGGPDCVVNVAGQIAAG